MDTNFLNALKQKAEAIQSGIKKSAYKPETDSSQIVIDSSFGTENQTIHNEAQVLRIERIVNKNRIDVYFDKKPSDKLRHLLVEHNFRFNPENRAWYMKDCKESCHFLETRLNVQGLSTIDKFKNEAIESDTVKSLPITENLASDFENESYQQYKKQVNQLIEALKCDIADLPMIAIDCLYRQTFN